MKGNLKIYVYWLRSGKSKLNNIKCMLGIILSKFYFYIINSYLIFIGFVKKVFFIFVKFFMIV